MRFLVEGSSSVLDLAEVRRAARLLFTPDAFHEIRALPSGRSRLVRGSDLDTLATTVESFADQAGIYYALNPVHSVMPGKCARNVDITGRHLLLIDIDSTRTDVDSSADEEEKRAASLVAMRVGDYLLDLGWPQPVLVDSGNGYHLLYAIQLPNDHYAQSLVKSILKTLASRFDTDRAHIDTSVHNAARIAKLPGTWSKKGIDTLERPHRLCRIVQAPDQMQVAPIALLEALAGPPEPGKPLPLPTHNGGGSSWKIPTSKSNGEAYVQRAIDLEIEAVAFATQGERNNRLNVAAFNLGMLVEAAHLNVACLEVNLYNAARMAGLTDSESRLTIRSGITAGLARPRAIPESKLLTGHAKRKAKAAEEPPAAFDLNAIDSLTILASEVAPKQVVWLWTNRIPKRFITVFAGRTGLGKSFVTCDLAARITTGSEMPETGGECFAIGGALFISEDPYDYILTPRLIELKADLTRISFLRWEYLVFYTLADINFLDRAWTNAGRPELVVIDPPTNFLGEYDEHRNAEIRQLLMKMVEWLKDHDTAVVLITHVNKQSGKGIEAVNRIMGSIAWASTARIAHAFAKDPDAEGQCLFVPVKNNLGPILPALAYRIVATDSLATVTWHGEVNTTADDAMNGEGAKPKANRGEKAARWLIDRFREKLEWLASDLEEIAKAQGISRNALFEAKKMILRPEPPARKDRGPDGRQAWYWFVPPDWPFLQETGDCAQLQNFRDS